MRNGALRTPAPPIAASLILPAKLMIYGENPAKNHSLGQNLGLLDPDPSVRGMDPDPDPSIIKPKKIRKTLISTVL
jgi:hypothetical protein